MILLAWALQLGLLAAGQDDGDDTMPEVDVEPPLPMLGMQEIDQMNGFPGSVESILSVVPQQIPRNTYAIS